MASSVTFHRTVPVRYEADVAVLGGGMAGASAALAAAQSGASVILVERFAVCGGNGTVGGVGAFCGETRGQGEAFDAIVAGLDAFGAIVPYEPYEQREARVFEPEILAIVLQELLLRRGVKLLLHTRLVDVMSHADGRISEVLLAGTSGLEALRAKQFIDATGEATVAHAAGFETVSGRPADGLTLPMSMMFFVRVLDEVEPQIPEGWFGKIETADDLPMTSPWPHGPAAKAIKIKIPRFNASDTESLTAAEIQGRRRMMEVVDYLQRVDGKPWYFDRAAARIGIREGRRIVGEHVLTVDELRAAATFDDAVAKAVFYLDGHRPDDDQRTYLLPPEQRRVPPYQIPFGSLVPRDAKNLLAAGRCLSADQLALSSARVMTTCAMMGQAAGIAAAEAARHGIDLGALDRMALRREIVKRGAVLNL